MACAEYLECSLATFRRKVRWADVEGRVVKATGLLKHVEVDAPCDLVGASVTTIAAGQCSTVSGGVYLVLSLVVFGFGVAAQCRHGVLY